MMLSANSVAYDGFIRHRQEAFKRSAARTKRIDFVMGELGYRNEYGTLEKKLPPKKRIPRVGGGVATHSSVRRRHVGARAFN